MITKYDSHAFVLRKQAYRVHAESWQWENSVLRAHTLCSQFDYLLLSSLSFPLHPSLPCEQTADPRRYLQQHCHTHTRTDTRIPAHTCALLCFDWLKKGETFLGTQTHMLHLHTGQPDSLSSRDGLADVSLSWFKAFLPLLVYWWSFVLIWDRE